MFGKGLVWLTLTDNPKKQYISNYPPMANGQRHFLISNATYHRECACKIGDGDEAAAALLDQLSKEMVIKTSKT